QKLGARAQSAMASEDRQQVVDQADGGAGDCHQAQRQEQRRAACRYRGGQRGDERQSTHRRRAGFGAVRFRRVLVSTLLELEVPQQRQQYCCGDQRNDESKQNPIRCNAEQQSRVEGARRRDQAAAHGTAFCNGFGPAPRHFRTTTGVCSSPLPCGLSSSARATASRSTPGDAPRTLAFFRSFASTIAHAAPVRNAIEPADASGSRGAKTIARSNGGMVPVYPSIAAIASPRTS